MTSGHDNSQNPSCHEYQRAIFTKYDYPTNAKSLLTLFSWNEYLLTFGMGELFVSQTGVWETGFKKIMSP